MNFISKKVQAILIQALAKFPENADFYYFMGLNEGALGNTPNQLAYLKKAYEVQPRNPKYSYNYILMLYNSGSKKEAKNELANALKFAPNNQRLMELQKYFSRE